MQLVSERLEVHRDFLRRENVEREEHVEGKG
jgi:hypothetical protein